MKILLFLQSYKVSWWGVFAFVSAAAVFAYSAISAFIYFVTDGEKCKCNIGTNYIRSKAETYGAYAAIAIIGGALILVGGGLASVVIIFLYNLIGIIGAIVIASICGLAIATRAVFRLRKAYNEHIKKLHNDDESYKVGQFVDGKELEDFLAWRKGK